MDAETQQLIDDVNQTSAEIKERDTVTLDKLVSNLPMFFYRKRNGVVKVRRSPYANETRNLWVKHPPHHQILTAQVKLEVARHTGEDCRIFVMMPGGSILELTHSETEFFADNMLISDMVNAGWQLTAR
jgi:hypothetical protein